jgi:hypothetical protein
MFGHAVTVLTSPTLWSDNLAASNEVTTISVAVGSLVAVWLNTSLAATEVLPFCWPVTFIQEIQHETNLVFPLVDR